MPAPGKLEHHPRAHGAADDRGVAQALAAEPGLEGVGEGGNAHFARQWRGAAEAGQVERDDLALRAERRQHQVPVAVAGTQPVDEDERGP